MQDQNHSGSVTTAQLCLSMGRSWEGYLQGNIHLEGKVLEWLQRQERRASDGMRWCHLLRCQPPSPSHSQEYGMVLRLTWSPGEPSKQGATLGLSQEINTSIWPSLSHLCRVFLLLVITMDRQSLRGIQPSITRKLDLSTQQACTKHLFLNELHPALDIIDLWLQQAAIISSHYIVLSSAPAGNYTLGTALDRCHQVMEDFWAALFLKVCFNSASHDVFCNPRVDFSPFRWGE